MSQQLPQRVERLRALARAKLAVALRPGQEWHLAGPDAPSPEWGNKRPPRRVTITDVQLKSHAVFIAQWPQKPLDPNLFVSGFYKIVKDNLGESEQIAYRRLPALSIQQPWAWAIMRGYKPVENRSWAPPHKILGSYIWVHASQKVDRPGIDQIIKIGCPGVPKAKHYKTGCILGAVRVIKVVDHLNSPWFSGPKGWFLQDPVGLPEPIAMKGQLKLWVPDFYRR